MRLPVLIVLVLLGVLAWSVLVCAAASPTSGLVNVDIRNVPIKQAIDTIFEGTGLKYYVQPGVTGRIVELKLKGISFDEALTALGSAAGFTYSIQDGAYVICPATKASKAARGPAPAPQPDTLPPPQASQAPGGPPPMPQGPAPAWQPAPVVVNNNITSPPATIVDSGGGGGGGGFGGFGFPAAYSVGNTSYYPGYWPPVQIGGTPYVYGVSWPQPPPPPEWVTPDVERFLRFEWAVPRRPGFASPYPYFYP